MGDDHRPGPGSPLLPIIHHAVPYACTQCGDCCKRPWTVGVDEEEFARYRAIDWSEHAPRLKDRTLFHVKGRSWTIAREPSGACIFLDADNRCVIHRVLGFDLKPDSCKSFPYNFIETPDDVRVSLSWATRGRRPDLVEITQAEREEIATTYARDKRSNGIFYVRDRAMIELVDRLRRFATSDHPAGEDARLIAIKIALDKNDPSDAALDEAARKVLPPASTPWTRRALALALPLALSGPVRTPRDLARIFFTLPHLGRGLSFAALRNTRFAESDRASWLAFLDDLLLVGLAIEPEDRERYIAFVITQYAFARWLAKLSAIEAGRSVVAAEDLRWGRAEAQSFTGPHRGNAGRVARRLLRLATKLYSSPSYLARLLAAEP